jgi:Nodulation protein S (NodS)
MTPRVAFGERSGSRCCFGWRLGLNRADGSTRPAMRVGPLIGAFASYLDGRHDDVLDVSQRVRNAMGSAQRRTWRWTRVTWHGCDVRASWRIRVSSHPPNRNGSASNGCIGDC